MAQVLVHHCALGNDECVLLGGYTSSVLGCLRLERLSVVGEMQARLGFTV